MGVASGCDCKEIYRFPHKITYSYILLLYLLFFAAASLLFVHLKKFFVLVPVYTFCNLCNFFPTVYINTHTGDYGRLRASQGSHMKGCTYTRRSTHKRTLHILRWTSAVCLQGAECRSRSRGRALYRDASWAANMLGPPPSRGGDLELEGGVNVSL